MCAHPPVRDCRVPTAHFAVKLVLDESKISDVVRIPLFEIQYDFRRSFDGGRWADYSASFDLSALPSCFAAALMRPATVS